MIAKREHKEVTIAPLVEAPLEVVSTTYWTGQRTIGFATMLGGGALAAAGGVAGLVALSAKDDSNANCPSFDGELRCTKAGVDAMDRAKTMSVLSTIGIGVGATAIVAGAYFFFSANSEVVTRRPTDFAKPKIKWDVVGSSDGARGVLSGEF
jgi:hypothetical protein